MTCDEGRQAMLSGADPEPLRQHLATCRSCRSEQPMWAKMRSTLSSPSLWEEPPADLADRIVSAVRGDPRASQPERQRTALFSAVAVTLLIALAGTVVASRTLTADWEVSLVTTAEAPEATVVVRGWSTARGTRMVLDVVGVEDAPSGFYYEIWLTAPNGRHISAGTFNGSGRVTAFVGVRRADYPRIWITLESVDNDLGPSPETYFDTT